MDNSDIGGQHRRQPNGNCAISPKKVSDVSRLRTSEAPVVFKLALTFGYDAQPPFRPDEELGQVEPGGRFSRSASGFDDFSWG